MSAMSARPAGGGAQASPVVTIAPPAPLLDSPLEIRGDGLPAGAAVTFRAEMPDPSGRRWQAHASFRADDRGRVDLTAQAPVDGTYSGVDPMGLIWSMSPGPGDTAPADRRILPPATVTVAAEVDGRRVAEAVVDRQRLAPGVERTVVRDHGLVGTLFSAADGTALPGVLLIGGSEGGLHEPDAALLAARGFTVLALAYFGLPGVPAALLNIPLEYFGTALSFLGSYERTRGDRLGVIGGSRGGEAALLIGATYPEIGAVVSTVGSGVITQCIGPGRDLLEILGSPGPSWTYRGRPLPYLPNSVTPELKRQVAAGEPVELGLAFRAGPHDRDALDAAEIPVEEIKGAVLLVSAGDDRMWPCAEFSELAYQRLRRHGHRYPFEHVSYPDAGHLIAPPPYGPATDVIVPGPGVRFQVGGTPAATAAARADAWNRSAGFLAEHLAG